MSLAVRQFSATAFPAENVNAAIRASRMFVREIAMHDLITNILLFTSWRLDPHPSSTMSFPPQKKIYSSELPCLQEVACLAFAILSNFDPQERKVNTFYRVEKSLGEWAVCQFAQMLVWGQPP
jgi:hypothetical protein